MQFLEFVCALWTKYYKNADFSLVCNHYYVHILIYANHLLLHIFFHFYSSLQFALQQLKFEVNVIRVPLENGTRFLTKVIFNFSRLVLLPSRPAADGWTCNHKNTYLQGFYIVELRIYSKNIKGMCGKCATRAVMSAVFSWIIWTSGIHVLIFSAPFFYEFLPSKPKATKQPSQLW